MNKISKLADSAKTNSPEEPKRERLLIVSRSVLRRTHDYFAPYFRAGVETACFWFGMDGEQFQVVTTVGVPKLFQTRGNYRVEKTSQVRLAAEMRRQGLTNLAQVHSPFKLGNKSFSV